MYFNRQLDLTAIHSSAFLFGPRMTGKTTLLRKIKCDEFFDLLDPEAELRYKQNPRLFFEQISALPQRSKIIVDEIQRVPELLNYVQMGIDRYSQKFVLSGSSARKLKRGGANLLGGRALDLKLHSLTSKEIGSAFDIKKALCYGTLPKIYSLLTENNQQEALGHLRSYVTTYIKEEIQAEALTRNIGSFQRFLNIAVQSNAQVIEFSNISRESSVPASTVKEYYQILEDTQLGFFLWPFDRNERKKARPKFYFFDCGVVRAIQNRLIDPPTPFEQGFLFENWIICELRRIRDYMNKGHEFSFWRERDFEVDILISNGSGPVMAIECKSGTADFSSSAIKAFTHKFPRVLLFVASLKDTRPRKTEHTLILPWNQVLQRYIDLDK
jgi:Predicted ATPase (AAA+ superfamily)